MAEYTGSRRAGGQPGPAPLSAAESRQAFAEDDALPTCPECGAAVRPEQEWCTLCLHVLRVPEPAPVVAPVALVAPLAPVSVPAGRDEARVAQGLDAAGSANAVAVTPALSPEAAARVEAAADALLAQLAVETGKDRLAVPSFLATKAGVALWATVGVVVLAGLGVAAMAIVGAVLR